MKGEIMKQFPKSLLILLSLLVLSGTALAQQNGVDEHGIYVVGSGTVYGEPDIAVLDLGVNIVNENLSVALDEANSKLAAVMAALLAAGVEERDIRTVNFNIYRDERYNDDGEITSVRYQVNNVVQVTVRDIDAAGALLGAAVEAGANVVNDIRFTIEDTSELERQAREMAMENARNTAEQLASLAGIDLGAVKRISENSGYNPPTPMFEARAMAMDAASSVPISGGQLAVTVTLNVVFDIAADDVGMDNATTETTDE